MLANLDFMARTLTVVYYTRILFLRWLDLPDEWQQRCLRVWHLDLDTAPTAGRCVLTLVGFGVAVTALTAVWFARREFRVKTPEGS